MCAEIIDCVNLYYSSNTLSWIQLIVRTNNIYGRVVFEKCYLRVKGVRNILHTVKMRKANWIGHILYRNCLLKHVIEGERGG